MNEPDDLIAELRSLDPSCVYGALIEIGKSCRRDLQDAVAAFLDHRDSILRGAALRVLGFYWRLPRYRESSIRLAQQAAFPEERVMAFLAISAYEHGTSSPEALAVLVSAANDPDVDSYVRASAYHAFLSVAGVEGAARARAGSGSRLDRIDWTLVARLLEGTGVEVPLRRTSLASRVRRVTCEWEIPAVLSSGASTLSAMFDGAAALVEVTQTTGHGRRQWLATLPDEAWLNLLSTLARSGFPATVEEVHEVERASHHRIRIAWDLPDSTESVLLERTAARYDQVTKLISTLVDQVARGVLADVASLPDCTETRVEDAFEVLP